MFKSKFKKFEKVTVTSGRFKGEEAEVEDLWINLNGVPFRQSMGYPVMFDYMQGHKINEVDESDDNNFYYCKIGGLGHILVPSELGL